MVSSNSLDVMLKISDNGLYTVWCHLLPFVGLDVTG